MQVIIVFLNNIFRFCSEHHRFLTHMLWEAFLTGLIIFQLLTLCVFFLLWSCVCGWWLQRYERSLLWFRSHSGQTKACVQNTNKAARLGDCPWQATFSGKYHLLCGFLDCTASTPSFYLSLKTQHSVAHMSTFSSLRTKLKTLVKEHSDYIRSYVNSVESVKEIGHGVESYWPLA